MGEKDKKKKRVAIFAETYYEDNLDDLLSNYDRSRLPKEVVSLMDTYNSSYKELQELLMERNRLDGEYRKEVNTTMALYKEKEKKGDGLTDEELAYRGQAESAAKIKRENVKKRSEKVQKKRNDVYTDFGNNSEKYGIIDEAFTYNAGKVKSYYAKKDPNVEVEIHAANPPLKNKVKDNIRRISNRDQFKNTVEGLSEEDDVVIMGHSGNRFMGVPNKELAQDLQGCSAKNVYLGSCSLANEAEGETRRGGPENNVKAFEKLKGKNVYYKPGDTDLPHTWYGFNPKAKNFMEGMYGAIDEKLTLDKETQPGRHYANATDIHTQTSRLDPRARIFPPNTDVPWTPKEPLKYRGEQSDMESPLPDEFGRQPIMYKQ